MEENKPIDGAEYAIINASSVRATTTSVQASS